MPFADFKKRFKRGDNSTKNTTSPRIENIQKTIETNSEQRQEGEAKDKEVEGNIGRDVEEDKDVDFVKPSTSKEEKEDETKKTLVTKGRDIQQTDTLMNIWDRYLTYSMIQVTYAEISQYVPNALPILRMMTEANKLMNTSIALSKYYSNYNGYAATTAAVLLYYIHILDCREKTGTLNGHERSAYNKFSKSLPFEGIKLPDFLFHCLDAIRSVEFEDKKYGSIVPTYSDGHNKVPFLFGHNGTNVAYNDEHGVGFIVPNYPAMLMMLASFGNETQVTLQARLEDGRYTPFNRQQVGAVAPATEGFGFPANSFDFAATTNITAASNYGIFHNCALQVPMEFNTGDADAARKYMRHSGFYGDEGVNFGAKNENPIGGATARTGADLDFKRIDKFLNLGKDQSTQHVEYLFRNLFIMCRFFKSTKNFSNVGTRGGLHPAIVAHMRTRSEVDATNHRNVYTDANFGKSQPVHHNTWTTLDQGNARDRLTANFECTKAGITRVHELTAFTLNPVAIPPIHNVDKTYFIRGKFYEDVVNQNIKFNAGSSTDKEGHIPLYEGYMNDVLLKDFIRNGGGA